MNIVEPLKKYQYPICIFMIPVLIGIVRYHDIRGSFFPESYDFKKTNGVIIESGDFLEKKGTTFDVKYSYTVNDAQYLSNRIGFSWKSSHSNEKIELLLAMYPKGKTVDVYFSSNNPSFSVLEPKRNSKTEFSLVFVGLFVFGAWTTYLTKKSITRSSNKRRKHRH